jgi:sigma-B regulation protein RsbU (phosphoserine phosphatase)
MVAARMVGGDFYDVFPLGPDSLGVVIGDVSGKGMPAALFMALVSSLLRAEAMRGDTTPEQALRIVNRHLLSRDAHSMFVTVLYGVLCRETSEFAFVRAGHELPLLLGADGALLTPAMGRGHPLGLFPNPMLDVQTVRLPPGGTLLLYTDGVNEAMDAHSQLFGIERIVAAVRGAREASAQQLCDQLVQAVTDYRGLAAQADDITLLAVRAQ